MYTHIYICIYVHTYIHAYIYIHIYIYVYIDMFIHRYVQMGHSDQFVCWRRQQRAHVRERQEGKRMRTGARKSDNQKSQVVVKTRPFSFVFTWMVLKAQNSVVTELPSAIFKHLKAEIDVCLIPLHRIRGQLFLVGTVALYRVCSTGLR